MTILEFRCNNCLSIFEQLLQNKKNQTQIKCIACGSQELSRPAETHFYPKKKFCPKTENNQNLRNHKTCGSCHQKNEEEFLPNQQTKFTFKKSLHKEIF